eukprot:g26305.t1
MAVMSSIMIHVANVFGYSSRAMSGAKPSEDFEESSEEEMDLATAIRRGQELQRKMDKGHAGNKEESEEEDDEEEEEEEDMQNHRNGQDTRHPVVRPGRQDILAKSSVQDKQGTGQKKPPPDNSLAPRHPNTYQGHGPTTGGRKGASGGSGVRYGENMATGGEEGDMYGKTTLQSKKEQSKTPRSVPSSDAQKEEEEDEEEEQDEDYDDEEEDELKDTQSLWEKGHLHESARDIVKSSLATLGSTSPHKDMHDLLRNAGVDRNKTVSVDSLLNRNKTVSVESLLGIIQELYGRIQKQEKDLRLASQIGNQLVSENEDFMKELARVRDNVSKLDSEAVLHKREIQRKVRELKREEAVRKEVEDKLREKENELAEAHNALTKHKRLNRALADEVQLDQAAACDSLEREEELLALRRKLSKTQQELASASEKLKRAQEVEKEQDTQLMGLRQENRKLSAHKATVVRLQRELAGLQQTAGQAQEMEWENQRLRNSLRQLETALEKDREEMKRYQEAIRDNEGKDNALISPSALARQNKEESKQEGLRYESGPGDNLGATLASQFASTVSHSPSSSSRSLGGSSPSKVPVSIPTNQVGPPHTPPPPVPPGTHTPPPPVAPAHNEQPKIPAAGPANKTQTSPVPPPPDVSGTPPDGLEKANWQDPLSQEKVFFKLTLLAIKLRQGTFTENPLRYINTDQLWEKAKAEGILFHHYHEWIEQQVVRSYFKGVTIQQAADAIGKEEAQHGVMAHPDGPSSPVLAGPLSHPRPEIGAVSAKSPPQTPSARSADLPTAAVAAGAAHGGGGWLTGLVTTFQALVSPTPSTGRPGGGPVAPRAAAGPAGPHHTTTGPPGQNGKGLSANLLSPMVTPLKQPRQDTGYVGRTASSSDSMPWSPDGPSEKEPSAGGVSPSPSRPQLVSPQTSKKLHLAANKIQQADALFVLTGPGMVSSSIPNPNNAARRWPGFARYGLTWADMASEEWFTLPPGTTHRSCNLAWAFWAFRLNQYKQMTPGKAYEYVLEWGKTKPQETFVFTNDPGGHWQKSGLPSTSIVETLGNLFFAQCTYPQQDKKKGTKQQRRGPQKQNASCSTALWNIRDFDFQVNGKNDLAGRMPTCPYCGRVARPNVLFPADTSFVKTRYLEQVWDRARALAGHFYLWCIVRTKWTVTTRCLHNVIVLYCAEQVDRYDSCTISLWCIVQSKSKWTVTTHSLAQSPCGVLCRASGPLRLTALHNLLVVYCAEKEQVGRYDSQPCTMSLWCIVQSKWTVTTHSLAQCPCGVLCYSSGPLRLIALHNVLVYCAEQQVDRYVHWLDKLAARPTPLRVGVLEIGAGTKSAPALRKEAIDRIRLWEGTPTQASLLRMHPTEAKIPKTLPGSEEGMHLSLPYKNTGQVLRLIHDLLSRTAPAPVPAPSASQDSHGHGSQGTTSHASHGAGLASQHRQGATGMRGHGAGVASQRGVATDNTAPMATSSRKFPESSASSRASQAPGSQKGVSDGVWSALQDTLDF